jgi:hypothetical protein
MREYLLLKFKIRIFFIDILSIIFKKERRIRKKQNTDRNHN